MSKKNLLKPLLYTIGTMCAVAGMSQNSFHYKASLGKVETDNFYKIILPPRLTAKCRAGLADLRIKDEKDNQVPYLVKTDLPVFNENSFTEFPIISNRREADKQTHVILQNVSAKETDHLLLIVKNTEATRTVTLSGSEDQHQWFVIKENIFLDNSFSDKGSFIQTLSFPSTNYRYFQVTIVGENILPVNIIKAGTYSKSFTEGKYIELPAPVIKQKDSTDKHSYVSLFFDDHYPIGQLELFVAGPKFYNREAEIFSIDGTRIFNVDEINSGYRALFPVKQNTNALTLVISNEDNPPLKVKGVKAWQLNQYLLAYLEKDKDYSVYFGDSSANFPKYDLEFFKDSVGQALAEITPGKIEPVSKSATVSKKPPSFLNTVILWFVIIIVLIVLLTLTFKMTKEVDKRK